MYIAEAKKYIGFTETTHAKALSTLFKPYVGDVNPTTTSWCAAFANSIIGKVGHKGTGSLLARSFLKWGDKVTTPKEGDILVFKRDGSTWQGHVGFYVGETSTTYKVLGGNQDNMVKIKEYLKSNLLGIRRYNAS
jgi:uncharacterized protein (TIGR02594 family)